MKESKYKLFLDDGRFPIDVIGWMKNRSPKYVDLYIQNWVVVKSYKQFTSYIELNGLPSIISFDHDIGYIENNKEITGYDCAKWLKEYCNSNDLEYPEIICHSMNPVGCSNINSLFL